VSGIQIQEDDTDVPAGPGHHIEKVGFSRTFEGVARDAEEAPL
jgi:hypothetical protein